jgi:hypothetical protein
VKRKEVLGFIFNEKTGAFAKLLVRNGYALGFITCLSQFINTALVKRPLILGV